jgi:hypothetical protein
MAQYYDPREASTTFSLYANIAQTQRQEEEAVKKKKTDTAKGLMTPLKMLEAKRVGDITEATQLLSERDPRTVTGRKYKSAEYIAPERKEYDPRKLSDWLNKRYGRSGEERVEYQELTPEAEELQRMNNEKVMSMWNAEKDKAIGTMYDAEGKATTREPFAVKGGGKGYGRRTKAVIDEELPYAPKMLEPKPGSEPVIKKLGKPLISEAQTSEYKGKILDFIQSSERAERAVETGTTVKTATEATTAVEAGGEVIGAVGETGETAGGFTPGISEAMAAGELAGIWSESGGRGEDKIKATAETGADLASSYAIASGNPYAMGVGLLYKGGKAAWEYLA